MACGLSRSRIGGGGGRRGALGRDKAPLIEKKGGGGTAFPIFTHRWGRQKKGEEDITLSIEQAAKPWGGGKKKLRKRRSTSVSEAFEKKGGGTLVPPPPPPKEEKKGSN